MKVIARFLTLSLFFCLALLSAFAQSTTPTDEVSVIQSSNLLNTAVGLVRGMSDDGRRIVLESTANLTGNNSDGNREIFVYDTVARTFIQITATKDVPVDPNDATKGIKTRVTNNAPVISGDGTRIAFSSNSGTLAGANDDGNQEIFLATLPSGSTTPSFLRVTTTTGNNEFFDNYSPTINFDGSLVGFVSTRDNSSGLTGVSNADGNAEIILYNVAAGTFRQVTNKLDSEAMKGFTVLGFNSAPQLSGNGNVLVFLSGFDYAPAGSAVNNQDFNGEIFLYNVGDPVNQVMQVTNTKDEGILPANGAANILQTGVRHLNNAGTLLAFESSGDLEAGKNADKTREVFLYNIPAKTFKQITNQTVPANPTASDLAKLDFNMAPGITPDGTQIFFASVLNLTPATTSGVLADNADGSREIFRYGPLGANGNTANAKFRQITFTAQSGLVLDQREAIILPNTNADGTLIAFSSNSNIIGTNPDTSQELFQVMVRPVTGTNSATPTLTNAANYVSATGTNAVAVGRGSMVTVFGVNLANSMAVTQRPDFDYMLGGVSVTVTGAAAQLIYVSPGQINFVLPQGAATGDAIEYSINNNGIVTKGTAKISDAGPGVFTYGSQGSGSAAATCQAVSSDNPPVVTYGLPPCAVSDDTNQRFLNIYLTGVRNAASGTITLVYGPSGSQTTVTPQYVGPQGTYPGLDQINILLPKDFPKGTTTVKVRYTSGTTTIDSNPVDITTQ